MTANYEWAIEFQKEMNPTKPEQYRRCIEDMRTAESMLDSALKEFGTVVNHQKVLDKSNFGLVAEVLKYDSDGSSVIVAKTPGPHELASRYSVTLLTDSIDVRNAFHSVMYPIDKLDNIKLNTF